MAQVEANRIIDALAFKLGRMQVELAINEIALADYEEADAERKEPGEIPRDDSP